MFGFRASVAFDSVDLVRLQAPRAVAPDIVAVSHEFDVKLPCRGQLRCYVDTILTYLWLM